MDFIESVTGGARTQAKYFRQTVYWGAPKMYSLLKKIVFLYIEW